MKQSQAFTHGRQLAYATDDLTEALETWRRWWIKREPTEAELADFIAGFNSDDSARL